MQDVRDAEDGAGEGFVAGEEDAEREGDGCREEHGGGGEPEMLEGEASDLGAVLVEEGGHRVGSGERVPGAKAQVWLGP